MKFQILSLSGGGFFGLYTASVLAELEDTFGCPIAKSFDLITGTSVGGIIALGLAKEVPAKQIKEAFEKNGQSIFSTRPVPASKAGALYDVARTFLRSKYDASNLRSTIVDIVGEKAIIGDLKHRTLIPTVNLSKGQPQIFKTAHHEDFVRDWKEKIVDVALATSAAPTYFPLAAIGDELFADGGLYANSPDFLAMHEAEHFLKIDPSQISVLSIGTTTSKFAFAHGGSTKLGILGWARGQRLVQTSISSQQQIVDIIVRHRLGDRYFRIDESQSKEQERSLALDVATSDAQRTLRSLAAASARRVINKPILRGMLEHTAPAPHFYHSPRS